MKRWMEAVYGDAMIDAVAGLGELSVKKYETPLLLAHYSGAGSTCATASDVREKLAFAQKGVKGLGEHETLYLNGLLGGLDMIARVLDGEDVPYPEQIAAMEEVESVEIPRETIEPLRLRVEKALRDKGYSGTLGEMVAAYLEATRVPADRVVATAHAFLDRCKAATERRILKLPEGDGITDISGTTGVFWSGNSAYLGDYHGKLTFNLDRPWCLPTFGNVLCHEGYPGHHAFYCHWDDLYRRGELPLEAAYYMKNTPTNPMFEGAPENALHFLGWDDFSEETPEVSDGEKADFALGRDILDLQRMYQQNGCHYVNVEGRGKDEVVAYMTRSGLFAPIEAANTYRFFTDPTRRTYYNSYYYGRWLVKAAYDAFPRDRREEFFQMLYELPHTNKTLVCQVKRLTGQNIAIGGILS